ncbi:MAG: glycosyltransferase family 39 protein [Steroidobacteraceae bacterium]
MSARATTLALVGLVLALWISALALRPLFNPDEGRYAEIPREMLASGDWTIPHLNGLAYIEKPPLQYWATAALLGLFGASAFAARLYIFLCAIACAAAIHWAARCCWDATIARRATAISVSMLLFILLGQLLTLDMSLTCHLTGCLCAFLVAQVHGRAGREGAARRAMLAAWVFAALGLLTKGLVAVVIPGAVLVLYTALRRDFSPWRRLHLLPGLALFALIALPWHALAQRRLPDFFQFFFVREHFARFMTPVADREEPAWFFAAVFLAGTLPWTGSALRCLLRGWRREAGGSGFDAPAFIRIWVLFILLFYSLSDSKLIPYILPALPAVALLVAAQSPALLQREVSRVSFSFLLAGAVFGAAAAALPWLLANAARGPYFLGLRWPLALAALLLFATGLWVRRVPAGAAGDEVGRLAAGWSAAVLVLLAGASALAPVYSGATLVAALPAGERESAIVYSVRTYDQTLPFYWRRPVTLVDYRGELDYGLSRDPGRGIASLAQFRVRWLQQAQAYAIMEPQTLNELRASGVPMRELARDAHRIVVARR